MATCASAARAAIPEHAAEDSFDMLPALLGEDGGKPIRDFTLHQTINLSLAIREGNWKFLDHKGSGGNRYDRPPLAQFAIADSAPDAPKPALRPRRRPRRNQKPRRPEAGDRRPPQSQTRSARRRLPQRRPAPALAQNPRRELPRARRQTLTAPRIQGILHALTNPEPPPTCIVVPFQIRT
ncbi:MAG: hypothetical protein R3F11_07275 [Verrucomicrobiales bacterium]